MILAFLLLQACLGRPESVVDSATDRDLLADSSDVTQGSDEGTPIEQVQGPVYEHLPVLFIDTAGQSIGSTEKIDAVLEVVRLHDGSHAHLDTDARSFKGQVGIEIHGSSSQSYEKKGYRFEIRDEEGEDLDVALLDMGEGSDWVLHAPYSDKTLLRNALAYELGRQLAEDTAEWQPRSELCEVYLNGSYNGVYLLVERVKRGDERLDIPSVPESSAEGDISGGYIVKLDQGRNSYWSTSYGNMFSYVYPRYEDISSEQMSYLQGWFSSFESMLWSDGWDDQSSGYPAWMHVGSFVDHFIIYELSHNIDAYRLSTYFYKEADEDGGLLHAGPLWDFDRAYGNVNYCSCQNTAGWVHASLDSCGCYYQFAEYWPRLLQDPVFTTNLRCRWENLRHDTLSDEALLRTWAELIAQVEDAEVRDHERWPVIGAWVDPNSYVGSTWQEELDWLETWLLSRASWMDSNLYGSCD